MIVVIIFIMYLSALQEKQKVLNMDITLFIVLLLLLWGLAPDYRFFQPKHRWRRGPPLYSVLMPRYWKAKKALDFLLAVCLYFGVVDAELLLYIKFGDSWGGPDRKSLTSSFGFTSEAHPVLTVIECLPPWTFSLIYSHSKTFSRPLLVFFCVFLDWLRGIHLVGDRLSRFTAISLFKNNRSRRRFRRGIDYCLDSKGGTNGSSRPLAKNDFP